MAKLTDLTGFLTSVDFTGTVSGVNTVAYGGTGLSTIAKGAMLYASSTDLIEATAYTKTEEVLKADGTKKTVAIERTYTAIRIDETKVQQFANNLVGLMQEHLNKFIILKTFVAKNGVTKVSSYEKNHLLS